jgi:hypothetical protein
VIEAIKYERFVRAWQAAKSLAEVGTKTSMHPMAASRLAFRLRKRGIPLKRFATSSGGRIDVEALKRIAEEAA